MLPGGEYADKSFKYHAVPYPPQISILLPVQTALCE